MAAITGTSMVAVGTCICDDKSSSKPLSLAEFTKRLRGPIDKIRKKVNRRTPTLEATVKGTTHELTLSTDVDVDEMSLLIFWSQVLSGEVSITTENRGGVRVHSLVAGDRRSSLVLNRSGSVCTASLFKEDGFTRDDVEYIVKGFDSAVSAPPAAPPAGRLSVDGFNDIFSQQFSVPFRGPGEESLESKGSSAPGSDPIKTLASLGVTVFDRQTGGPDAALDWDCLAGYSAIKDLIEETVVLAVTHPEVFDSVARSTRVVFESNRPKAVLLEGPPGTGRHSVALKLCTIQLIFYYML